MESNVMEDESESCTSGCFRALSSISKTLIGHSEKIGTLDRNRTLKRACRVII